MFLLFLVISFMDVKAANYGASYNFELQPYGAYPDVSSSVTKNTQYDHATVFVNSNSRPTYATLAYVGGAQRSYNGSISGTGSFNIYYRDSGSNGGYYYGSAHNLYMQTDASNPYITYIQGSWTP